MYGILLLAVYTLIMVGLTLLATKRAQSALEFHVGGRDMGAVRSALSIAATWIWAPALFTSAEKAYTNGIPGLFWFLVPNVLCLLFFIPFAKRIRERMPDGITLSGFMGREYGSRVRGVYLAQLSALTVLSTGVQLLAGGKILSMVTGLPFFAVTVILAAIAFSYSWFSGIKASVITDALQMVLILAACFIFVPWALKGDGISSLINGLAGASGQYGDLFSAKGLEVFFAFGLPTAIGLVSGPFGDQCFWQRAFAIKTRSIGKSFALGALLFGIVPLSMGILGYIAAGSGFIPADPSVVNLELITHLFPAWATVPFLFMLISGLLSTVDSNLCAAASLTTDVTKSEDIKIPRLAMVILLVAAIVVANIPGLTVTQLFLVYGTLRSTTLLPTVMTLLGKKLSAKGVAAGVIISLCVGLPVFACGTLLNLSLYKTIGSLFTVLSAGVVALTITRLEARRHAR